jgi:hypothetical protein
VFCVAFPKTINGKIDRSALPSANTGQIARQGEAEQPRNDLEKMLVDLWNDCLGVTEVGIHDDFFAIGGSSLLVTRVIAGIRKRYQLAIPVRDFFANPTVASIARLLGQRLQLPTAGRTGEASCRQLRDRLPSIDAFYFPCGQESLFAVRYPAIHKDRKNRLNQGVLICPPDGHEYARSHRNLQQLAMTLAALGIDTLRFDFSGSGNSSGDNRDGRIERWQQQIHAAVDMFRERASLDAVTAIGLRLGATLLVQDVPEHVDRVLLWDPVDSGEKYLQLLDHFQHRAMNDVTHYPVRRKSSIPQTFGVEMSTEKRTGYQKLMLPIEDLLQNCEHKVLFSRSYREDEGLANRFGPEFEFESQDEIYWHDWKYVHSAFSSPQISNHILEAVGVSL